MVTLETLPLLRFSMDFSFPEAPSKVRANRAFLTMTSFCVKGRDSPLEDASTSGSRGNARDLVTVMLKEEKRDELNPGYKAFGISCLLFIFVWWER